MMSTKQTVYTTADSAIMLLSRALLAAIFIISGYGKIFSIDKFAATMASHGLPLAHFSPYAAIVIELLGGLVFLLGFQTRLLAVLFAIYTIFTGFVGHAFWNLTDPAAHMANQIHFLKNLAIAGGFLAVVVTAGGRFSIDTWLKRGSDLSPSGVRVDRRGL
jgi:putative oxidoreductase